MKSKRSIQVSPRFRILIGNEIALGPGKADLLEAIAETGSIRLAARKLKMSYMRAWKLIQTMNQCFREPLVVTERGGGRGGKSSLSALGRSILNLYRKIEKRSMASTKLYLNGILCNLRR